MLVYIYNEKTKEFLYEEEAFLDPLETEVKGENVYLLPENATFEKYLDKQDGKAIVFDKTSWKLVDDNRGKYTIKDNQIQEITTLDHVERVLTDEEVEMLNSGEYIIVDNEIVEKPAPTKEEIRQQRIAYRKANIDNQTNERTRRMANGTWTEQDEHEYLELDAQVTAWIEEKFPYPEEV